MDSTAIERHQPTMIEEEGAPQQAPTLRDFFDVLRRRKAIALQTFVLVTALGVVSTLMTKPSYRSSARVLVQGKQNGFSLRDNSNPMAPLFEQAQGHEVQTQVEILRSPVVLDKVYKETSVPQNSVFLDVKQVRDTDVIELAAISGSRDAAERFARALPEVYLRGIREDRMREVSTALEFAQHRLVEESTKLSNAELALEKFKKRSNVVSTVVELEQDITAAADAKKSLRDAQASAAAAQAQVRVLQGARNKLPSYIETPVTSTNTAQIQALEDEVAKLEGQRKQKLFLYKPQDDEVRQIDVQIADAKRRLAAAPRDSTTITRRPNEGITDYETRIAQAQANYESAQANAKALQSRVAILSAGLGKYPPVERQQAQLERDRLTSANTVTSLSTSVEQLSLRQKAMESQNDPVKTIEAAGPAMQTAPRVTRSVIMAIALGLLLACGAALLQDSLDDRIHDEEEARRLLNTPVLGHFPMLEESERPALLTLAQAQGKTARQLLENFRVLRSNVQFTLIDSPNRTLMVTSAMASEGKSYTASNLAVAMALDGRQVVLVDADLHRPRLHHLFDVPRQPGLTSVLAGEAKLDDVLHSTGVTNLRFMPAGVTPPNPAELLNSPTMQALFEEMKTRADVIIFDTPPLLATADAQVMASRVDGVLYVMNLGRVPRSAVHRSFELLHQARARVIGMVFNKIEQKSHREGYYGYSYGYGYSSDDAGEDDHLNGDSPNGVNGSHAVTNGHGGALKTARRLLPSGLSNGSRSNHGTDGDDDA